MKVALGLALAAPLLYVIPQAYRQSQEFVWLKRASQAPAFSSAQVQLLKKANAVEPMNPATTFAIAEIYRQQSQEGGQSYVGQPNVTYRSLAEEAMQWFKRGMALNRYDSRNWSGYGWCLDWLDRQSESPPYFAEAERLDPNNYFNVNYIGLHYLQSGNLAAAKVWFERSTRLEWNANDLARSYLPIIRARLMEGATNDVSSRLQVIPQ
jgi:tetratricopeptide (TPR) repeat protein